MQGEMAKIVEPNSCVFEGPNFDVSIYKLMAYNCLTAVGQFGLVGKKSMLCMVAKAAIVEVKFLISAVRRSTGYGYQTYPILQAVLAKLDDKFFSL